MSGSRQLKLGAFMRPASIHTGAWRYPGAFPDANFNFAHQKRFIQTLERGKFDAYFMADHLAVLNMPIDALKRSHTATSFEPFTLLSALAAVTERIGLVATGSTTFDLPYHVARRFASLDHISNGRAGWNVVTSANDLASLNFSQDRLNEHELRYEIATEFVDVGLRHRSQSELPNPAMAAGSCAYRATSSHSLPSSKTQAPRISAAVVI